MIPVTSFSLTPLAEITWKALYVLELCFSKIRCIQNSLLKPALLAPKDSTSDLGGLGEGLSRWFLRSSQVIPGQRFDSQARVFLARLGKRAWTQSNSPLSPTWHFWRASLLYLRFSGPPLRFWHFHGIAIFPRSSGSWPFKGNCISLNSCV